MNFRGFDFRQLRIMKMKIGSLEINGKAVLAPMAGVTDAAYRRLCVEFGAAYTVTEMVSARALQYQDKKTDQIADLSRDRRPVFLQLFGDDPVVLALAAKKAMKYGPDGIDINMGCPVPKVAGNGSGSALMKTPDKCGVIVASVKRAVEVPVTVKIRKGWDEQSVNAVEVAKYCEEAGADALCIHGRTRNQMYAGQADWESIRQVKRALSIPVIGNGDVTDAQSAAKMLEETGCDLVMVGRGALGNPWIFRQINAYLTESCCMLPPPGVAERIVVMKKHMDALCALKGEHRAMREARKHVGWYLHGLSGAAEFRRRAGELCTLTDLDGLLREVYACNMPGTGPEEVK